MFWTDRLLRTGWGVLQRWGDTLVLSLELCLGKACYESWSPVRTPLQQSGIKRVVEQEWKELNDFVRWLARNEQDFLNDLTCFKNDI